MKTIRLLPIVAATICPMWPISLLAADDTGSAGGSLEEIVVTAEKRPEDVDKVPISISVFNRSMMDERSIQDMADIAAITPGVDYQNLGGTNRIAIRGITTASDASGFSTTGLYIDDVPIQVRPSNAIDLYGTSEPKVFDLDRVEVLRGPQGTLFGAGAEGGAIRFITPQPSLTNYSAYARAGTAITDGGGPSYEAGAAVGGPIVSDELGFRVSAWERRDGGYIQYDNPLGGYKDANGNWADSSVVRIALTYAPTASLKITPSLYYQDVYTNNMSSFEPASSAAFNDYFTSQWSKLGPQYSNVSNGYFVNPDTVQTPSHDIFYIPAFKLELALAPVDITSSTSYMYRKNSLIDDFTAFAPHFYGVPGWTTLPGAAIGDRNIIQTNQNVFTQEVRVQSVDQNQRLQWTLGAFYTEARQLVVNQETNPYLPTELFDYFGETLAELGLEPKLLPGSVEYYGYEPTTDQQTAVFGQATYQIFKQWSLLAGVRVARESDKYSAYQNGPELGAASVYFAGEQAADVVDPKFGINYQLDDNNLLYVSAAKGDRTGGVNSPLELGPPGGPCEEQLASLGEHGTPQTYKGDSLWSYEVGSKNKFLGGRVNVEASIFHIDWNNVQEAVPLPACASSFVSNLGKATSNGFDLQTAALITDSFQVALSMGYTDAKSTTNIVIGPKLASVNGTVLNPYASPWIISPNAQYNYTWINGNKGYVRLDDVFHSKNNGPFAADDPNSVSFKTATPFIPNPSYNELNIHVGTTWDHWDVSLYAANLLNTHPVLYNTDNRQVQPTGAAFTIRPLTIGVTAIFRK